MATLLLGNQAAQPLGAIGTMLDGEQRLQLQGLLDVEGGELVAGLRRLQRADRGLRASEDVVEQPCQPVRVGDGEPPTAVPVVVVVEDAVEVGVTVGTRHSPKLLFRPCTFAGSFTS